jgi:cysteine-rich repeat protein
MRRRLVAIVLAVGGCATGNVSTVAADGGSDGSPSAVVDDDAGADAAIDGPTIDATTSVCGDGVVSGAEECDDANMVATDRCDQCVVTCLGGEHKWSGNNHCYSEFTAQKTTYATAQQACKAKGGYLVSITSPAEQDFVYGTVIDKSVLLPRWLGLTDIAKEGTFAWETGEPVAYVHWTTGQPDDFQGTEDCAELYHVTGEWNDDNCTYEYHYVCEFAAPVKAP